MLPVANVERTPASSSLLDVLDRVLDKGIVIDAWVRLSLVGIELITVQARVVVASITTYLGYSEALAEMKTAAAPRPEATIARAGTSPSSLPLHIKNFVVHPPATNGSL